MYSLLQNS
uniref:Uncharacterized protein n=1 Tax=Arundo donax TaxID=35708 RepID=A0A0A9BY85_ARUDO